MQSGQFARHDAGDELRHRAHRVEAETAARGARLRLEGQPALEELDDDLTRLCDVPAEHIAPLPHGGQEPSLQGRCLRRSLLVDHLQLRDPGRNHGFPQYT